MGAVALPAPLTEQTARARGVVFYYDATGRRRMRAPQGLGQAVLAERERRAAALASAPELPRRHDARGACDTCGEAFEAYRSGTCWLCVLAWALVRERRAGGAR